MVIKKEVLNPRSAGEPRLSLSVSPPVAKSTECEEQPEQGTCEVNPHGVLHTLNILVAFWILMDVHL